MEKRARTLLEKEIEELKKQSGSQSNDGHSYGNNDDNNNVDVIKKMLRDYEEKIISLEAEVSKWEQKYLEESTLRTIELSAAFAPK